MALEKHSDNTLPLRHLAHKLYTQSGAAPLINISYLFLVESNIL